jgi:hypothetical protein
MAAKKKLLRQTKLDLCCVIQFLMCLFYLLKFFTLHRSSMTNEDTSRELAPVVDKGSEVRAVSTVNWADRANLVSHRC